MLITRIQSCKQRSAQVVVNIVLIFHEGYGGIAVIQKDNVIRLLKEFKAEDVLEKDDGKIRSSDIKALIKNKLLVGQSPNSNATFNKRSYRLKMMHYSNLVITGYCLFLFSKNNKIGSSKFKIENIKLLQIPFFSVFIR